MSEGFVNYKRKFGQIKFLEIWGYDGFLAIDPYCPRYWLCEVKVRVIHVIHYNDVIMGVIASQITSLTIVYSTIYSDADQRKHQSSASLAFMRFCLLNHLFRRKSKKTSKLCVTGLCAGNSLVTSEFPTQMASNVENVSIWWRHHDAKLCNFGTAIGSRC